MKMSLANPTTSAPSRYLSAIDRREMTPVHAVWEITLGCDLKCQHCGSRAGKRRHDELSTGECLDLVQQLANLGTREVTLIGGEAYLRKDWTLIIRSIRDAGMDCTLQSGGLHLNAERIRQAVKMGLKGLGISIDGLEELHDELRGVPGSFAAAFKALSCARSMGITTSVNTQITSRVLPQLREMMNRFISVGARNWQVQLTVAMGRAADHPELLLQPYEVLELQPLLAELYRKGVARGLLIQPGNNIGYFGPYESLWRGSGDERVHWTGCNAGQNTIGIEADGTVKGCPSLATVEYAGGNIRDRKLSEIWKHSPNLSFSRKDRLDELWGYCRQCYYAKECQGGCTWTSQSLLGRPGNNPYCYHRAYELARDGLRERVVMVEAAPGNSFDHGRFELNLEPSKPLRNGVKSKKESVGNSRLLVEPRGQTGMPALVQIKMLARKAENVSDKRGRSKRRHVLEICRSCHRHVWKGTITCPHCGADMRDKREEHARQLKQARKARHALIELLQLK